MPDSTDGPEATPRRSPLRAHWAVVLGLLSVTFVGMLGAIYWVVRSARP